MALRLLYCSVVLTRSEYPNDDDYDRNEDIQRATTMRKERKNENNLSMAHTYLGYLEKLIGQEKILRKTDVQNRTILSSHKDLVPTQLYCSVNVEKQHPVYDSIG